MPLCCCLKPLVDDFILFYFFKSLQVARSNLNSHLASFSHQKKMLFHMLCLPNSKLFVLPHIIYLYGEAHKMDKSCDKWDSQLYNISDRSKNNCDHILINDLLLAKSMNDEVYVNHIKVFHPFSLLALPPII